MINSIQISLVLLMIALTACVSSAHQPVADTSWEREVKSNTVPPHMSRVEIHAGNLIIDGHIHEQVAPANIVIDGTTVGGLNKGEVMALDLKPGTHSFTWVERSPNPFPVLALVKKMKAGEITQLTYNTNMHIDTSGAILGGILGGAVGGAVVAAVDASTNDSPRVTGNIVESKADITGMTVVMPDAAAVQNLK